MSGVNTYLLTCSSDPPDAKYSPDLEKTTAVHGPYRFRRGNLQFIEKWHLLHRNHLLWNHSYLWRPMFVDYQILLVHWDVISWITSFVYYTIWPFITLLNRDINIKGNQQNTESLIPHEQWWFQINQYHTVICKTKLQKNIYDNVHTQLYQPKNAVDHVFFTWCPCRV